MKRIHVVVAIALAATVACKKDKDSDSKASAAAKTTEPAAVFTGALTMERLLSLKKLSSTTDWDKAEPEILAALGKTSMVMNDVSFWAAAEGQDCAYMSVDAVPPKISALTLPKKVTREAGDEWKDCMMAAGATIEEEPPPPYEKKAKLADVTTEDIQTVAKAAGWKFVSMSGMGMGGQDSKKITFTKDGVEAIVTSVRPNGKEDTGNGSMKPMPVPQQAERFEGVAFATDDAMLGVAMGEDMEAAAALVTELAAALLVEAE